jgi:hypothetical protein
MPVEHQGIPIKYDDMMAYAEPYGSHVACMVKVSKFSHHVDLSSRPPGEPFDDEDEDSPADKDREADTEVAT